MMDVVPRGRILSSLGFLFISSTAAIGAHTFLTSRLVEINLTHRCGVKDVLSEASALHPIVGATVHKVYRNVRSDDQKKVSCCLEQRHPTTDDPCADEVERCILEINPSQGVRTEPCLIDGRVYTFFAKVTVEQPAIRLLIQHVLCWSKHVHRTVVLRNDVTFTIRMCVRCVDYTDGSESSVTDSKASSYRRYVP